MLPEDPLLIGPLPEEAGYDREDAVEARQLLIEHQVELCHDEGILKEVGSINVGAIVCGCLLVGHAWLAGCPLGSVYLRTSG